MPPKRKLYNIHVGQFYIEEDGLQDILMLARVERDKVALICLRDGNRLANPHQVDDDTNISPKEFAKVANNSKLKLLDKLPILEHIKAIRSANL